MEFIGCSKVNIDSKGSIIIPVKFRKKLEDRTIILSKVNVIEKPVIAAFPSYKCAKELLSCYFDFSDQNYDRNLSILTGEYTMDNANRISIGRLLEDREEKEMIAVGRLKSFELWYRSDLMDYCKSENLHFYM